MEDHIVKVLLLLLLDHLHHNHHNHHNLALVVGSLVFVVVVEGRSPEKKPWPTERDI